jgi:hypothetical protein
LAGSLNKIVTQNSLELNKIGAALLKKLKTVCLTAFLFRVRFELPEPREAVRRFSHMLPTFAVPAHQGSFDIYFHILTPDYFIVFHILFIPAMIPIRVGD